MNIKYVLLFCLLANLMSFCYSWWGDGGDGGKGGNAGKNGKAGDGGGGGDGWLFGDGGHGGPGGNAGKGGTPGKGGKGGKGGLFGKDGNDGRDGKNERWKIRKIERLLKSLQNDSPISKRKFIPKFDISNEIRDGKITHDEFANIVKRPDMEKIMFWKLDVNSDKVITCEEIETRKLLHLVNGC